MLKRLWGVNIAVENLDEAVARYEPFLGIKPTISDDPKLTAFPGLKTAIFNFHGYRINLMTSDQKDHPVRRFLDKRGEGLLLVSILSDDIENDTKKLKVKGVKFFLDKTAEGGFGKVNFLPPSHLNGVQWEILEPSDFILNITEKQ